VLKVNSGRRLIVLGLFRTKPFCQLCGLCALCGVLGAGLQCRCGCPILASSLGLEQVKDASSRRLSPGGHANDAAFLVPVDRLLFRGCVTPTSVLLQEVGVWCCTGVTGIVLVGLVLWELCAPRAIGVCSRDCTPIDALSNVDASLGLAIICATGAEREWRSHCMAGPIDRERVGTPTRAESPQATGAFMCDTLGAEGADSDRDRCFSCGD